MKHFLEKEAEMLYKTHYSLRERKSGAGPATPLQGRRFLGLTFASLNEPLGTLILVIASRYKRVATQLLRRRRANLLIDCLVTIVLSTKYNY